MSARYARLDTEMGDLNKEGSLATGLSGEQLSQDRKHGKGLHLRLDTMEQLRAVERESGWSFHQAAREGRVTIILDYLKSKPYRLDKRQRQNRSGGTALVNVLDNDGLSALHYAARYNHGDIMQLLLDHGADVNVLGEEDLTPIHHAARYAPKGTALDSDVIAWVPLPPSKEELDEAAEEAALDDEDDDEDLPIIEEGQELVEVETEDLENLGDILAETVVGLELKVEEVEEVVDTPDIEMIEVQGLGGDHTVPDFEKLKSKTSKSYRKTKKVKEKREKTTEEMIAEENGSEPIKFLLNKHADVNSRDIYGMTALHCAADRGNYAAVVELTNAHLVNIDARDNLGETPLHVATNATDLSCVRRLLKFGANPNAMSESGMTPFHVACNEGDIEIMKLLWRKLIKNPNVNANFINDRDQKGMTALHYACQEGNVELVNFLLRKGADVSLARTDKDTGLHIASNNGYLDCVEVLIEHNIDLNLGNEDRETALHVAANFGRATTVKHLIDKGADIEARDASSQTPLIMAAAWGHFEVVQILLEAGASVAAKDKHDKSAIFAAIEENKPKVLKLLLDTGGQGLIYQELDRFMNSPVHLAAEKGFVTCLNVLLDFGFIPDAQNDDEACPLHLAAQSGRIKSAKVLIEKDQSLINDDDEVNNKPLHLAAASGHYMICELLCEKGADVDARNQSGWTAMDCAAAAGRTKTLETLLDNDAEVDPMDKSNTTPLHLAAKNGHVETVHFLLEKEADLTLVDTSGRNALEMAIYANKSEVVLTILRHKKWYNAMNNLSPNGDTPMKMLIRKMPEVALEVFNKCTSEAGNEEHTTSDRKEYQVKFDYRYLDEFERRKEEEDDSKSFTTGEGDSTVPSIRTPKKKVEVIYKHPLQVMINAKRTELLDHPLVRSLVYNKWSSYGRQFYYSNLFIYTLFLIFLTINAVTQIPPFVTKLDGADYRKYNSCFNVSSTCVEGKGYAGMDSKPFICFLSGLVVIVLSVVRIGIEFIQLAVQRLNYMSLHNVTEIILFSLSIFFTANVFYPEDVISYGEWQVGVMVIFLAWMNLLMFLRKFPKIGIYIVMFNTVLVTFMEIGVVLVIFIAAFAFSFKMSLSQYPSFSDNAYSLARTFIMMTGEFEFDSYYTPETLDSASPLYYKQISFIMFFVFIVIVPIVFMNLLVGLAVDDIQDVYRRASLELAVMKIQLIFQIELLLPESFKRKHNQKTKVFYPNKKYRPFRTLFPSLGFRTLGFNGEAVKAALDTTESTNEAKKSAETIKKIDKRLKEVLKGTNNLLGLLHKGDTSSTTNASIDLDNDFED